MQKKWIGLSVAVVGATAWLGIRSEFQPLISRDNSADKDGSRVSAQAFQTQQGAFGSEPNSSEQKSLLDSALVKDYLHRKSEKQALQDYFNNPSNDPELAKDIWQLIERTEAEGGVLAFEAMHLKMAWLEKNHSDQAEFEVAAKELVNQYRERSQLSAEKFNPENTPEFQRYKDQEQKIIQEVYSLEIIPNGLTREAYLREKLLVARMSAYGEDAIEMD